MTIFNFWTIGRWSVFAVLLVLCMIAVWCMFILRLTYWINPRLMLGIGLPLAVYGAIKIWRMFK